MATFYTAWGSGGDLVPNLARLTDHPAIASLRSRSWAYRRQFRLDRAIRAARASNPGPLPDILVSEICETWGDAQLNGADGFMSACLDVASRVTGPILQCGAGLSTLLLGLTAERSNVHLWTLEHHAHAANSARSWLHQYEIANAHVISAPADLMEDCVGYVVDANRLPANLGLVICEGSSAVPASARSILSRVGDRLDPNGIVLVHHVKRRRDAEFLAQWAKSRNASMVLKGKVEPWVKIAMRDPKTPEHSTERLNTPFYSRSAERARAERNGQ
jgi:hypothetical protein